jgi:tripartite-type tricarboxylate transporter receptor subunit TctC
VEDATMMIKHLSLLVPVAIGANLLAGYVTAEEAYPSKTITIILPGPPGGPADVGARLIAERLQSAVGQTVIVENRPVNPKTTAKAFASASPDGHTLLMANTSVLAIFPAVSKNPGYDPSRDFAPVASIARAHQVLVVHPAVPAKTLKELLTYAKANPGKLNYAAAGGVGGLPHLAGELFKRYAGVDMVPVFFKGAAEALTAVLGGHVQVTFENITILLPLIQSGQLRALAVTSETRNPQAPDLPNMIEAGVPDYVVTTFLGLVAPAGTPPGIVGKLNVTINEILHSAEMQASLRNLGSIPQIGSPQEFAAFIASESRKWAAVAKSASIAVD